LHHTDYTPTEWSLSDLDYYYYYYYYYYDYYYLAKISTRLDTEPCLLTV